MCPTPGLFGDKTALGAHGNSVLGVIKVTRKVAEEIKQQLAKRLSIIRMPVLSESVHVVVKVDVVPIQHYVLQRQITTCGDSLQVGQHGRKLDVN